MKKLLIILISLIIIQGSMVYAEPYLVCDPTDEPITEYKLMIGTQYDAQTNTITDGVEYSSVPKETADGKLKLYYDLESLKGSNATYYIKVKALSIWGESVWTDPPFLLNVIIPSVPQNIAIK